MFVRWSNLTAEGEPQHKLPGYRDPASVRRFSAPEALDMRFYEVGAKSVLNKVPDASAMPFRWTVNPYRGCSHACSYCLRGTRRPDGGRPHQQIREIEIGDRIYGTAATASTAGSSDRDLDKWSSIKPA